MATVIGLLMTCALGAGALTFALKRASLAQALCVTTATHVQDELAGTLDNLLKLNPAAQRLRFEEAEARLALKVALGFKFPPAIAAAEAKLAATKVAQTALHAAQLALLSLAEMQRRRHELQLGIRVRSEGMRNFRQRSHERTALAVRPEPRDSLSPDYVLIEPFLRRQAQGFEYDVDLAPRQSAGWMSLFVNKSKPTVCSVSLRQEGRRWKSVIVAASVPWK